jgi:hypothetical protein
MMEMERIGSACRNQKRSNPFFVTEEPTMVASVLKERRIGLDRRQFAYDLHIPERRRVKDRRHATIVDEGIRLPDLPRELVARWVSDSCLFPAENETVRITFDDNTR